VVRFASSDIKICLFDGTTYPSLEPDLLSLVDTSTLVVLNKKDLLTSAPASVVRRRLRESGKPHYNSPHCSSFTQRLADGTQRRVITISCKNYEGLEDLTKALESQVKSLYALPSLSFFLYQRSIAALAHSPDTLLPTRCSFESGAAPDGAVVTRARHREHLERSLQHLRT
jgi:tRNA modification GTPase